jgi:seryl-tRNA synthetase
MLDIQFIRDNPKLVEDKARQKGYKVDIKHLLELDQKRRDLLKEIEQIRAERNKLAESLKKGQPSAQDIEKGRALKEKLDELEKLLDPLQIEYQNHLKEVPNMPVEDVPVGSSEADNVKAKEWGEIPQFNFEPKTHWQIAESRGLINKERAAKVAGSRFAYILGDLVKLQFALIQWTINILTDKEALQKIIDEAGLKKVLPNPFTLVLPPQMIRTEVFDSMDRLEPRDDRYKIEKDDLWLQGSAEHTMGPMFSNETIAEDDLPLRFLGYATSFRREAGNYGKDTEGIIRMHQFDKLEMESFVSPEHGLLEHHFFVAIQEHLMQQLNLPYRLLLKCTADIGKPNARGIDLEVWLPGQNKYLETHTADFMTDYQARRLGTKYKKIGGSGAGLVYTNDATAFAMGRTMVAIIENYQNEDDSIRVPDVLQPYMNGQAEI